MNSSNSSSESSCVELTLNLATFSFIIFSSQISWFVLKRKWSISQNQSNHIIIGGGFIFYKYLIILLFCSHLQVLNSFPSIWKVFQRFHTKQNISNHLKQHQRIFSSSSSSHPASSNMKSTYQPLAEFEKDAHSAPDLNTNSSNVLDGLTFYESLRNCKDNYISKQINSALTILTDALRLYGPKHIFSSYNGGKDADVIMHLLRAVYAKYQADQNLTNCQPTLIYFAVDDEFPEVLQHIRTSEKKFQLNIISYECGIIEGIKRHVEELGKFPHSAFVLGTRKGDPNCGNQEYFTPSSSWMPVPFMRVNPILNWEYGHVWHFLRLFKLPYCSLYDDGYTSLGKKSDTQPNPALERKTLAFLEAPSNTAHTANGNSPSPSHWPAYMLADWSLERAGRVKNPSLESSTSISAVNADCTVDKRNFPHLSPTDNTTASSSPETIPENKTKIESAALIIIGDEILNGLTSDMNLLATSKALQSIDIPLKMVSIVSDDVNEIANEVIRMSQKYDIVITSGGIGPTHDDVTIKAIAKALKQEMKFNIPMLQHLEEIQIEESSNQNQTSLLPKEEVLKVISVSEHDVDEYWEKAKQADPNILIPDLKRQSFTIDETMEAFAFLPKESVLHFPPPPDDYYFTPQKRSISSTTTFATSPSSISTVLNSTRPAETLIKHKTWPILQCDNIYILPGVPQYYAKKIHLLAKYFLKAKSIPSIQNPISSPSSSPRDKILRLKEIRKIVLNIEERNLINSLNSLVEKYSKDAHALQYVKFGSYPFIDHPEYKTIITIESYNLSALDDAMSELLSLLPSRSVLRVEKIDLQTSTTTTTTTTSTNSVLSTSPLQSPSVRSNISKK